MAGFWEIRHSDGDLVQRITSLTRREHNNLKAAGFELVQVDVDKSLVEWLRPVAWKER